MAVATLEEVLEFCKKVVDVYVDRCYHDPNFVDKDAIYEGIKKKVTRIHNYDSSVGVDKHETSSRMAPRKVVSLKKMLKEIQSAKTGHGIDDVLFFKTRWRLVPYFMNWLMRGSPYKPDSFMYDKQRNVVYDIFMYDFQLFSELAPATVSH